MVIPPYVGGVYYYCCGDRPAEQIWLDRAILHLRILRGFTDDQELKAILTYTIERYNKIGAWDVMILPLISTAPGAKVIGCNFPWCPGVTLDPEVLHYPIAVGSLVLVHESLHDTYLGHDIINPLMERIERIR